MFFCSSLIFLNHFYLQSFQTLFHSRDKALSIRGGSGLPLGFLFRKKGVSWSKNTDLKCNSNLPKVSIHLIKRGIDHFPHLKLMLGPIVIHLPGGLLPPPKFGHLPSPNSDIYHPQKPYIYQEDNCHPHFFLFLAHFSWLFRLLTKVLDEVVMEHIK